GIHNIFHAALCRIHKPNNGRLFPGQLNEQSEEPEVNEWAAEQTMVHHETKSDAMFEVLWKAGDKSWMSYDQVKDPNLLAPYLELLGLQTIEELKDKRIRQPPQDDPQVFLGQVLFQDFLGDKLGETY
ncbi:hypothetical protein J132_01051, partial [Termitomyces sp. J132]